MEWKLSGWTLVQAGLSACCRFNRGPLSLSLSLYFSQPGAPTLQGGSWRKTTGLTRLQLSCSNRLVSFPRSCFIGASAPHPACSRHTSVTAELSERGSPRSLRQSIASEWALLSGRTTATLHRALICYLRTGKVVGCLAVGVQLNRREMSEARVCRENVKPLPAALPRRQLPG